MMNDKSLAPAVIVGLAVGIGFLGIMAFTFSAFEQSTSVTKDGIKLTLAGVKSRYPANEALWFTVSATGYGKFCSPLAARVLQADTGNIVTSYYKGANCSSVEEEGQINQTWSLHDLMGENYFPQLIHQTLGSTGHLKLVVEFGGLTFVKDFVQD